MKVAFCTHVSDDWFESVGARKLAGSLAYFHPEIPFYVFGSGAIKQLLARWNWSTLIAPVCQHVATKYGFDSVVHFDADSCLTDSLDELLAVNYGVVGVRNNNDENRAGCYPAGYTVLNIPFHQYLNAGLVGCFGRPDFWTIWMKQNLESAHKFQHGEQDVLNTLVWHSDWQKKFTLLDSVETDCYYGLSSHGGVKTHYDNWKLMRLEHGKLRLKRKKVKVLHQAGGYNPHKLDFPLWFKDVELEYLTYVCNTKPHFIKVDVVEPQLQIVVISKS